MSCTRIGYTCNWRLQNSPTGKLENTTWACSLSGVGLETLAWDWLHCTARSTALGVWCVICIVHFSLQCLLVYRLICANLRVHADILTMPKTFSLNMGVLFPFCSILLAGGMPVHSRAWGLHRPLHQVVQLPHTSSAVHPSEHLDFTVTSITIWSGVHLIPFIM